MTLPDEKKKELEKLATAYDEDMDKLEHELKMLDNWVNCGGDDDD